MKGNHLNSWMTWRTVIDLCYPIRKVQSSNNFDIKKKTFLNTKPNYKMANVTS